MTTEEFKQLFGVLWDILIHDPAMEASGWVQSDPTGWAIRYTGLQLSSTDICLQSCGLAVALFTKELPRGEDEPVDVPARTRELLGFEPEVFMRAGVVACASRLVRSGRAWLAGTITNDLIDVHAREVGEGVAVAWSRFTDLTSLPQQAFKQRSRNTGATPAANEYDLYRFNLLRRYPLVETGKGRFVAPDPYWVMARTALGMYFDGLEADGERFTQPFGFRFANLVGDLCRRAFGDARVWSESRLARETRAAPPSKNADHALIDASVTILVECKALRPNNTLIAEGAPGDVDKLVTRITAAVRQLTQHARAIGNGDWITAGLCPAPCYGVVVTYERIPTVQGALFRGKVREAFSGDGTTHLPYLVLSINEFDSLLRLVELGHTPGDLLKQLVGTDEAVFPGPFEPQLRNDAISLSTRRRGEDLLATLPEEQAD